MTTTVTNPTSRARYTFSHLHNSLSSNDGQVQVYEAELLTLLQDPEMNPLVVLELFAQWEQTMACCDQALVERHAALSQALRAGAQLYLGAIPQ